MDTENCLDMAMGRVESLLDLCIRFDRLSACSDIKMTLLRRRERVLYPLIGHQGVACGKGFDMVALEMFMFDPIRMT